MTPVLDLATFAAQLHTPFRVQLGPAGSLAVELIEAVDKGSSEKFESFSLLFLGPGAGLQQGLYAIEHDAMGAFDLFIVPIARDERGFTYEAVFNRIRPKP